MRIWLKTNDYPRRGKKGGGGELRNKMVLSMPLILNNALFYFN